MKFLKFIWGLVTSFFLDVHKFLDEKRVYGILFLTAALVAPFVVAPAIDVLGSLVVVGVVLFLGIQIGAATPIGAEIESLGLLDLITTFDNKGDPGRLFGNLFLIGALAYVFAPLVIPGLVPVAETLWLFEGAGVVLLFGSAIIDKPVQAPAAATASPVSTGSATGSSV